MRKEGKRKEGGKEKGRGNKEKREKEKQKKEKERDRESFFFYYLLCFYVFLLKREREKKKKREKKKEEKKEIKKKMKEKRKKKETGKAKKERIIIFSFITFKLQVLFSKEGRKMRSPKSRPRTFPFSRGKHNYDSLIPSFEFKFFFGCIQITHQNSQIISISFQIKLFLLIVLK